MSSFRTVSVVCNLCGTDESQVLFRVEGLNIVECERCGLVFVNPRLPQEVVNERYSGSYFEQDYIPKVTNYYLSNPNAYDSLLADLEYYGKRGSLLDIGSGTGDLLNAASAKGWDVLGVELSPYAAQYAKQRYGVDVLVGDLYSVELPKERFDVVTMVEVIEHLADPLAAIKKASGSLRPGGLLYLTTPNFHGIGVRLLGADAAGIWPREHLYYFTPRTATKLIEVVGMCCIRLRTIGIEEKNIEHLLKKIEWIGGQCYGKKAQTCTQHSHARLVKRRLRGIRSFINMWLNLIRLGDKIVLYAIKD